MSSNISSSLIDCCRSGDEQDVKHIIAHYKFFNFPELLDGYVLIRQALKYNNNTQVAKLLLESGAKSSVAGNKFNVLLHLAVARESVEIIQLLLMDRHVDVNAINKYKKTPLHVAIERKSEKIVQLLLDNGADTETRLDNQTPLCLAAKNGLVEIVEHLLNHDADIHASCQEKTALQFAVENNCLNVAKLLVESGAMVKIQSAAYSSLLHLAILQDNCNILLLLLEAGNENLEQLFVESSTSSSIHNMLHKAVSKGNEEMVAALVKYNFDLNAQDECGQTPVFYAYSSNKLDMCKFLLANGARIDSKIDGNCNILHLCVSYNDEKFVKYLLEIGANIDATTQDGSTSLHLACIYGRDKIVKLLLKYKIDVFVANEAGSTSLHEAAKQDNVKIVQRLLRKLADVKATDDNHKTPICYAVERKNINVVRLLLDKHPDPEDVNNKLAFCLAIIGATAEERIIVDLFLMRRFRIKSQDFDTIPIPEPFYSEFGRKFYKPIYNTVFRDLLKRDRPSIGAYFEYKILTDSVTKGFVIIVQDLLKTDAVNVVLQETFTLLQLATQNCQTTMMAELLKLGANLYTTDNQGNSLLHTSVENNCEDSIQFLMQLDVNVEARNMRGETALHRATRANIVNLLLNAGADINAITTTLSNTLLHLAVENRDATLCKFLLQHDANVHIKNANYETPLDLAISSDNCEIFLNLLQHGAIHNCESSCNFLSREMTEISTQHAIKLKLLERREFEQEYVGGKYDGFVRQCSEEIDRMIHCQIVQQVSLYDLLTKSESRVELYMRNEHILEFVDSSDFDTCYPIYCKMLSISIDKAKKRSMLIKSGNASLESILKIKIPYLIAEKISCYISNLDLRNLISASIDYRL